MVSEGKRKGLVVPYTGTLGPRKRARTSGEKEQRRVERILRNRAAAQQSRERKRKQVEGLEEINDDLSKENEALIYRVDILEREKGEMKAKLDQLSSQFEILQSMVMNIEAPSWLDPASILNSSTSVKSEVAHPARMFRLQCLLPTSFFLNLVQTVFTIMQLSKQPLLIGKPGMQAPSLARLSWAATRWGRRDGRERIRQERQADVHGDDERFVWKDWQDLMDEMGVSRSVYHSSKGP